MLGKSIGDFPSSSLLYDSANNSLYENAAGRDWVLVNGAFQPTITITAKRWARCRTVVV